jgi:hypothetical protein
MTKREQTPHNAAVQGFAIKIREAEAFRRTLSHRFGYSRKQIGQLALIYYQQEKELLSREP